MSWKNNIHKATKCSAKLFAPRLDMRWRYQGHLVSLYMGNERIWHSSINGYKWEHIDNNSLAQVLNAYYSTPVEDLRQRKTIMSKRRWWAHGEPAMERLEELVTILYAADKRIGKNQQSIWLFTEKNGIARRISHMRVSNGK